MFGILARRYVRYLSIRFPNLPEPPPMWVLHATGAVMFLATAVSLYQVFTR